MPPPGEKGHVDPQKLISRFVKNAQQGEKLKVRAVAKPGKERDTDLVPYRVVVMCNMYKTERTDIQLPKLPAVRVANEIAIPEDYRNYRGKMSTWYTINQNKAKRNEKKPPKKKLRYVCNNCEWSFEHKARLERHNESHKVTGSHVCQYCLVVCNYDHNMQSHWKKSCGKSGDAMKELPDSTPMESLRMKVMTGLDSENRTQEYHVFGGSIFMPTPYFLSDPTNVNMRTYTKSCHLCALCVPLKYSECHSYVHRGRFRIDGCIYGDYFCHICCVIFKHKEDLIMHWRNACKEVIAYTPDEFFLNDEEMAALVWLILQQSVPPTVIARLRKNTNRMLERRSREHAYEYGLNPDLSDYAHFPQEIWPLQTMAEYDIVNDSLPIWGPDVYKMNSLNIGVHQANMLATCCPDFYATGIGFFMLAVAQEKRKRSNGLYKVIVRYTIANSAIATYKFSEKTCPRLRAKSRRYNTEKTEFVCNTKQTTYVCDEVCASEARYEEHRTSHGGKMDESNWCLLCHRIINFRSDLDHWRYNCEPLKVLFEEEENLKFVDAKLVRQIDDVFNKFRVKVSLKYTEKIFVKRRGREEVEEKVTINQKNQKDESQATKVETIVEISDKVFSKVCQKVEPLAEAAKERYEESLCTAKNFQPSGATVVTCPHCGGRFLYELFIKHLEQRHFYPEKDPLVQKHLETWKDNNFEDGRNSFEKLATKLAKPVCSVMSEACYNRCVEFFTKRPCPVTFATHCQKAPMVYAIVLGDKRLDLIRMALNDRSIVINSPEFDEWAKRFYPNFEYAKREPVDPKERILWFPTEEDENQEGEEEEGESVTLHKQDPMTGELLDQECASVLAVYDRAFIGKFRKEAANNGLEVTSISDFYLPVDKNNEAAANGVGQLMLREEVATAETIAKFLLDDDQLKENYSGEDSSSDELLEESDDEDDDDDENSEEEEEEEEESDDDMRKGADEEVEPVQVKLCREEKLRRRELRAARRAQKEISMAVKEPKEYDEEAFAPLNSYVDPARAGLMVRRYAMPTVVLSRGDSDEQPVNMDTMALAPDVEALVSDFRKNAVSYSSYIQKFVEKNAPPQTAMVKARFLSATDKTAAVTYEKLIKDASLCNLLDQYGTLYLKTIVMPDSFEKAHLESFYVIKENMARKMQVFRFTDNGKRMKLVIPADEDSDLTTNPDDIVFKVVKSGPKIVPAPRKTQYLSEPPPVLPPIPAEDRKRRIIEQQKNAEAVKKAKRVGREKSSSVATSVATDPSDPQEGSSGNWVPPESDEDDY